MSNHVRIGDLLCAVDVVHRQRAFRLGVRRRSYSERNEQSGGDEGANLHPRMVSETEFPVKVNIANFRYLTFSHTIVQ